ncbi:hypothetical protein CONLIGDRAFT_455645 [Coniochaeta ligniaria NRRL 30616]|uniref:Uncharacterized protein n=1 Tax=Coniochaeta ligniaria NRRL 30616 TaxID=1408157 RepID=A0A1J7IKM1_9PEZI|nr:hypothetical protein CONLIGDRAFT_455645 [Coniochaeta ligniaria NRRL 30616]
MGYGRSGRVWVGGSKGVRTLAAVFGIFVVTKGVLGGFCMHEQQRVLGMTTGYVENYEQEYAARGPVDTTILIATGHSTTLRGIAGVHQLITWVEVCNPTIFQPSVSRAHCEEPIHQSVVIIRELPFSRTKTSTGS